MRTKRQWWEKIREELNPVCSYNMFKNFYYRTRQEVLKNIPYSREDGRCHDCGCLAGEKHYTGCDVEECPKCHKQLLVCGHKEPCLPDKISFGKETR